MSYYKHPSAQVDAKTVGTGTQIWQHTIILENAVIGENCNINCFCFIENDVIIGDRVTVKSGVYLWNGVRIENDVFIGPNVTFTNDLKPRSKKFLSNNLITVLKKGCSIGAGAIILPSIVLGEYCMIGAGSVVTKSVGRYEIWYGNPAQFHGYVCRCGKKIHKQELCDACNIPI